MQLASPRFRNAQNYRVMCHSRRPTALRSVAAGAGALRAARVQEMLVKHYGFNTQDMQVLTEEEPKENWPYKNRIVEGSPRLA